MSSRVMHQRRAVALVYLWVGSMVIGLIALIGLWPSIWDRAQNLRFRSF